VHRTLSVPNQASLETAAQLTREYSSTAVSSLRQIGGYQLLNDSIDKNSNDRAAIKR
jgi:hypothetical protein